jgi:hypothetical protein
MIYIGHWDKDRTRKATINAGASIVPAVPGLLKK